MSRPSHTLKLVYPNSHLSHTHELSLSHSCYQSNITQVTKQRVEETQVENPQKEPMAPTTLEEAPFLFGDDEGGEGDSCPLGATDGVISVGGEGGEAGIVWLVLPLSAMTTTANFSFLLQLSEIPLMK